MATFAARVPIVLLVYSGRLGRVRATEKAFGGAFLTVQHELLIFQKIRGAGRQLLLAVRNEDPRDTAQKSVSDRVGAIVGALDHLLFGSVGNGHRKRRGDHKKRENCAGCLFPHGVSPDHGAPNGA